MITALQSLLHDLPYLPIERVQLLALELQRARQVLAVMIALVLAAPILLATAWIALWVRIATALVDAGLARGWVALLTLVLNTVAAAAALWRARSMNHLLTLPATMRRLTVAPATPTPPESDVAVRTP